MRKLRNSRTIFLVCLILASAYAGVAVLVDVFHTHEDKDTFHDNCAACRWLQQSQDTSVSTTAAQVLPHAIRLADSDFIPPDDIEIPNQFCRDNPSSRSPPSFFA